MMNHQSSVIQDAMNNKTVVQDANPASDKFQFMHPDTKMDDLESINSSENDDPGDLKKNQIANDQLIAEQSQLEEDFKDFDKGNG